MPATDIWLKAAGRMLERITDTADQLHNEFPHWANSQTGLWTTTSGGDWTGGAWPGQLWLAYKLTGEVRFRELARTWCLRLRPRATMETVFKGFGFYCGAALGEILARDETSRTVGLEAATSLARQFDPRLGLIPLGKDAEEAGEVGSAFSSIDSLQAVPLLLWAADLTGEVFFRDAAVPHQTRVLEIHCQSDGSIIQSSELNARDGSVIRYFTHKGYSDTSIWGRAQAWGTLYSIMGYARDRRQPSWLTQSMAAANWWLAHVPADRVAFWDFDDPAIPNTERDTAATAIMCAALLKLGQLAPPERRAHYRAAAEGTAEALVKNYLTPTTPTDKRPRGMFIGGCFNKRPDSRPHDATLNAELIFGSYFLFECLLVLGGGIVADKI
jgi:unsaturated chondroitin disaccharide hydrolase